MGKRVERRNLVITLYQSGLSISQVAKKLGCTGQNVQHILKYWSVPRRLIGNPKLPRPKCKQCGEPCKERRYTYCSPKCVRLAASRPPKFVTLVCKGCGIQFDRSRHLYQICQLKGCKSTYHSHACYCKNRSNNA